jgi:hypothetical protein
MITDDDFIIYFGTIPDIPGVITAAQNRAPYGKMAYWHPANKKFFSAGFLPSEEHSAGDCRCHRLVAYHWERMRSQQPSFLYDYLIASVLNVSLVVHMEHWLVIH